MQRSPGANSFPKMSLELRTLIPCFVCSHFICKCRVSDVGFSKWGVRGFILIDITFYSGHSHIHWAFPLVFASLEENHLQYEGVCSLAEGLQRNSSLKVLK